MECSFDSKPRWERRKDARPQELLAAAIDLFVERGFAATRLEDVARRAGVTKGTLYLYYTSKEELFKAVVRESIVPFIGEAEHSVAEFDGHSADLLRTVMLSWWSRIGQCKAAGISKLMMAEAGNFPELARFYQEEVTMRGTRMISSMLERGVSRGEFRNVNIPQLTQVLIAPMLMLNTWKYSAVAPCDAHELQPLAFIDAFLDLALHGLLPNVE
ncbi:TetR/AcrR family transcriptional regulator [Massilia sp. H6]|uniref:TetR/AcrR family transcriptional regulator n=1 Tax=Massilia sp. H6 TaxID=2970464 RepID=UPI00216A1281|nr:TetR/AcrR family transcriptional regulator [Massilia sp. H6]UVW28423.1 TetR/AcrR family transcriptional regulator [Massilia sp. H6]